ncbi:hypothetical protein [Sphingobacterium humi]|uniref:Fimbrillin family protein n=1 Tax=Sphingobacterium humi TaxID=1796905 RepID=A0A6N8L3I2_9SPHI|nr:hypothetical protein [Sphingobacterium humi]MVZ63634.1 hypothetical protein [Sphingobacterium humi]
MNRKLKNCISKLAFGMVLTSSILFANSCAKDSKEDISEPGIGTRVVVNVGGIDEMGKIESKGQVSKSLDRVGISTNALKTKLVEGDGFDVLISQSSSQSLADVKMNSTQSSSSGGIKAAATPMPTGSLYRLYLRKQGEIGLTSSPFTAGVAGSIAVEQGQTYEWFALSYNNATTVPDATNNIVEIADGASLLYAKGTFSVPTGNGDVVVPLNIVFRPRVSKVNIEINTMGMFAAPTSATATVTGAYAKPDAIDVVTGELVGTSVPQTITFANFSPVPNTEGQRRIATAYLAGNSDENINVSVSNLKIQLDDNTTRDFGASSLSQSFAPQVGMEQNIILNFIETPLTTSRNGTTVRWARSNLYYQDGAYNSYRFFHKNPFTQTAAEQNKSFFSFRGHLPRRLANATESLQKDPCSLVYPAGLWKTPSDQELSSLTSSNGLVLDLVTNLLAAVFPEPGTTGATFGANYIQYSVTNNPNPAYNDATNNLRFNYNGLQTNVSLVSGLINLNLLNVGELASLWSSDRVADLSIVEVGAWGYLGSTAPARLIAIPPRPERAIGARSAGVLNIDLLNLGLVGSGFHNVRCVRDASWTAKSQQATYNPYPSY